MSNLSTDSIKTEVDFVLISVCSYKRPVLLKEALLSVNNLQLPQNIKFEVLVVDNDEEKSAESTVNEVSKDIKLNLHYVLENKRGIANARNRVLEEAIRLGATHILFFDDDEFFDDNCVIEHLRIYQTTENAVIISGPVKSVFKEEYPDYIKKNFVFKQESSKETGDVKDTCATGNVFFPVSVIKNLGLKFDSKYKYIGGEDGDFFKKASQNGYTIVWNKEAVIYETVPEERANINYVLKKCYYNGYAKSFSRFKESKKNRFLYILKEFFVLIGNIFVFVFSIFAGITAWFNSLGMLFRTFGKIAGAICKSPYNFYKKVYGK